MKLGTPDRPIFWYKLTGAEKYRVIYADLSVKEMTADEVKNLQNFERHVEREIESVLGTTRGLALKEARKRLRTIEDSEAALNGGADVLLEPYCFALKQALRRFIKAGERIQKYSRPN